MNTYVDNRVSNSTFCGIRTQHTDPINTTEKHPSTGPHTTGLHTVIWDEWHSARDQWHSAQVGPVDSQGRTPPPVWEMENDNSGDGGRKKCTNFPHCYKVHILSTTHIDSLTGGFTTHYGYNVISDSIKNSVDFLDSGKVCIVT